MAMKKFSLQGAVTETFFESAERNLGKQNLINIKYLKDEQLYDYSLNNEDISNTEDIEKSIEEQGFTDPIEVTDYGNENGFYTIISGHRRRMAGRKQSIKEFPCIIRHFNSSAEVQNYVLLANSQRDSSKDPLLYAKRYKMHENYLKSIGFKGSLRDEISKRLGLKSTQADRYSRLNLVIFEILDLIKDEKVSVKGVIDSGLYTHSPEEQENILKIMNEFISNDKPLSTITMNVIVKDFRSGKKTYEEMMEKENDLTPGVKSIYVEASSSKNNSFETINQNPPSEGIFENEATTKVSHGGTSNRGFETLKVPHGEEISHNSSELPTVGKFKIDFGEKSNIQGNGWKIENSFKANALCELTININGWCCLIIYGKHINGYYCVLPKENKGCEMAEPSDIHYNTTQLSACGITPVTSKAIAEAIKTFLK